MDSQFLTIRQTAKKKVLSEHHLRLMEKQGRLPGIYAGNRFLVNYPVLLEQLDRESRSNAQASERVAEGVG